MGGSSDAAPNVPSVPLRQYKVLLVYFARNLDGRSRRQPQGRARPDAALSHFDHARHLRAVRAGIAAARSRENVGVGRVPHVKTGRGE